jgi:hypothetical protein
MSTPKTEPAVPWAAAWLDSVAIGLNTMRQRRLSSIQKHAGDLEAVKTLAEEKGVHLLLIEDDEGNEIIAASKKPFRVIC